MTIRNRQTVLIATDSHDVEGHPDEQWIGRASACAMLLHQDLAELKTKTYLEKQLEELLWYQCKSWGWSKWDFRSTWHLKEIRSNVDRSTQLDLSSPIDDHEGEPSPVIDPPTTLSGSDPSSELGTMAVREEDEADRLLRAIRNRNRVDREVQLRRT